MLSRDQRNRYKVGLVVRVSVSGRVRSRVRGRVKVSVKVRVREDLTY
jgi:hypothetical protein